MTLYNLTNLTNSTNIFEYYASVNTISGNLLAAMLLFVLFLLIMIITRNYDWKVSMLGSGFVTTIVAIMFFWLGLINYVILIIPIILLFGSILIVWFVEG